MRVTERNLPEVLEILAGQKVLALDTETTGLGEYDTPFAMIIATDTNEFYFDTRELSWWNRPDIQKLFNEIGRLWLFQNAKFDMRMIGVVGYQIEGTIIDIAILARLVRNDHLQYSLEAQAKRMGWEKGADLIKKYIKDHDLYEVRKDFFGVEIKQPRYDWVPIDLMETYAKQDARLTYDLHKHYQGELMPFVFDVLDNEARLTKVCFDMERRGLLLNKDYTIQARFYEMEIVEEAKLKYKGITGIEFINSAKSFQTWLGDRMWLPVTDAGNPSLTDEVLETLLARGDEIGQAAQLVQTIRHHEKRINTYYDGYLNALDDHGVVHPTMWQAGTSTGRFSYSNPNLQNIPKEKKSEAPYVVRGCFKPRPGSVFVSFDYSQMEYRLMAAYANETEIIRRVMGGEDFHEVAAQLFGVERDPAKTLNFAVLYGAGDKKLAGMLALPLQEAALLKLKYFLALPRVEKFIDQVKSTAKSRGWIKNWFGRPLFFDWFTDPKTGKKFFNDYAAPNHLIQGGGADVVKKAMVQIHREISHIPMVLQIHDQLVFEVLPQYFPQLRRIQEIMENAFPEMNGMKLKVDVEWSDKSLAVRDMKKGFPDGI